MIELSFFSESGGHTTNEDALLCIAHPADESVLICALADGQGGRPGGLEAAQAACRSVVENACTYSPRELSKTKRWRKILRAADAAVHALPEAGATTLVGACITSTMICGASNGDSAAVVLNVYDQHYELSAEQMRNPPVGSGQAKFVPFSQKFIDPWLVMLASDGLWKYVGWSKVNGILRREQIGKSSAKGLIDALVAAAQKAGQGVLRDDTTIVIVKSASSTTVQTAGQTAGQAIGQISGQISGRTMEQILGQTSDA